MNILGGKKIIEEVNSPINGKISVVKSLGLGIYLQVENLTQSGGVVKEVWETSLKKARKEKNNVKKTLILGLGGGSACLLVKKYWPESLIEGVDIDTLMVELGKKYLDLQIDKVFIKDAEEFLKESEGKYDLILVDMYIGDRYPEKFSQKDFLLLVKERLEKDGLAIFNRLYYGEKRKEAVRFGEILDDNFQRVERVYPEANLMFLCFK